MLTRLPFPVASTLATVMSLIGALALFGAAPVQAGEAPHVSWTISPKTQAGQKTSFTYSVSHTPSGSKRLVQRQEGTKHVWRTVLTLKANKGRSAVPALAVGVYALRLADIKHGRVLASEVHTLKVFGTVPLKALLPNASRGIYTTNNFTFPYVARPDDVGTDGGHAVSAGEKNSCRSLTLRVVVGRLHGGGGGIGGQTGTLRVVQESLDPQTLSATPNQIYSFTVRLVPAQSWSLNLGQTGGDNAMSFYLSGSAVCDTTRAFNGGYGE